MLDDEQDLLARAQNQDVQAFQALVDRYKRQVYYLGLDLTGNHHDAEDLAQETFMKAYQSIQKFRGDSKIGSWLHRIAVNTHIDAKRKKAWTLLQSFDGPDDDPGRFAGSEESTHTNPHRKIESEQLQARIDQALECLSPKERTVFVLRHYQDFALKEIAESLKVSEGTVKSFLFRAVKKLQKSLAPLAAGGRSSS